MRQGVTALLGGLLLLALAGCAVPGGVHLDGWTVRQVRVTVVAGPSWPIRDATVAWFRGAGEDSPRLTTTTDASGQCQMTLGFFCGVTRRRRSLLWWSWSSDDAGRFVVSGTLEIQAQGYSPLRVPLAEAVGRSQFSLRKKTSLMAKVKLQRLRGRSAADEQASR